MVLADGTELTAPVVVSALDARRTFLDLVDPRELPDDLVDNVRRTRYRGTSAKVNFALDGMPEFPGLPGSAAPFGGFINIGPTLEYLERAYDAAKYGWYSDRPFIDGAMQSVIDPDMAPPGKHVLSCFVQHAPYELKGPDGSRVDWETERENFGDKAQAVLEEHFPGLRQAGAAARGRHAGRHRAGHRADRGQHLRRRVPRPADVLLPARARLEPVRHPDRRLLPVRLRHPPRRLRDRLARAGSPASGSCATARGRADARPYRGPVTDWLQIALSVLSFGVALLALGYVARDRSADRFLLGALGVLWVGTVVQLVYGFVALASTDRDVHAFVFVLYLLGLVAVPPLAAWWARGEPSRAGAGRRRRGRAARPLPAAAPRHPLGWRCLRPPRGAPGGAAC